LFLVSLMMIAPGTAISSFSELLSSLKRTHAAILPELHHRACAWFEEHGLLSDAHSCRVWAIWILAKLWNNMLTVRHRHYHANWLNSCRLA
jgi:hypothetical protein